jgi:hypothetical protein
MGVNPALMSMPGMYSGNNYNDDMAQYMAGMNQMYNNQQSFTGGAQQGGDTFERQSGGDFKPAVFVLGSTAGAGAYGYIKANPFEGKVFSQDFLKNVGDEYFKHQENLLKQSEIFKLKKSVLPEGVKNQKMYEAIRKMSTTESFDKLPPDMQKWLEKSDYKTTEAAKKFIEEFDPKMKEFKIEKMDDINKAVAEKMKNKNYREMVKELDGLNSVKSKLANMADDVVKADLEKLIKKNPKLFGITADKADDIASQAGTLAAEGKAGLITKVEGKIAAQQGFLEKLGKSLEKFGKHFDSAKGGVFGAGKGGFKNEAPKFLESAFGKFKWQKAGKFAAIAGGIALFAAWAFGGKKS